MQKWREMSPGMRKCCHRRQIGIYWWNIIEEVLIAADRAFRRGRGEEGKKPRHGTAAEFKVRSALEGNQTGLRLSALKVQVKGCVFIDA